MDFISTIPKGQLALLVIAGSLTIMSSFYLITKGNFVPFGVVVTIGFLLFIVYKRIVPSVISRPPSDADRPFDVFRDMEPKDQTRVNPWVGFLQEDVYTNRTGPIGDFVGKDDYVKRAPLYSIDSPSLL
jgi:hypothetical protein